jgi:twinkle protein
MHQSQMQSESEFLRHEPCPSCGSRNNLARYDDGHGFCFGCNYYEPGDGSDYQPSSKQRMTFMLRGSPEPLPKRRISEEVCKKYRVHREADLPSHGKRVVITEGELDALSCQEAMPGWPMVSIPDGAKAAKRAIQRQLEWLQGYEEIVLFFDNDEHGREAAKDAASILPPGKCTIARLDDWKDASDALQAGEAQKIREAIWNAKPFRPDGIVEAKNLLEVITTPNPPCAHEYPFNGLQTKLHGIRYGELVTITAGSGIGKSSFCRELTTHLLNKGERIGYLALEESNRRTALGLMSCAEGKAFHIGEHIREELTDAYEKTLKDWNLYLFDGFGSFDPDIIYNRVEYLAQGLDVKVVILDHLSRSLLIWSGW